MRISQKKWILKVKPDDQKVFKLSKELGVSKAICSLLVSRDIDTFEKAKTFFRPQLNMLHDPFLMKDMDKAVYRITTAISSNESIRVYGDYDVDGTTSVSLMYSFLKSQKALCDYYIPDRYNEGYGVSYLGIDDAIEKGITLMITLDCGVKAIEKIAYAQSKGLDIIVCDHHRPGEVLPNAFAVLDPKREDCEYPFKELCGCGVGFKLMQAYLKHHKLNEEIALEYLDYVAVAIGADIVPIVGENRVLAFYGLKLLNAKPRMGMLALMKEHKSIGKMTITDVVFTIAPRINAAGRMKHAHNAVRLLIEENESEAIKIANDIEEFNTDRRSQDQRIAKEAHAQILENKEEVRASTVVYNPEWHKGVIGIVASRLIETYYRPTVVFTKSKGGVLAASVRSVYGFDVYEALEACKEHIDQFGGHMYAAGLTLKEENYEAFKDAFEKVVSETITEEQKVEVFAIDAELYFADITEGFNNILKQFEPFGPENMAPLFVTKNVLDKGYSRAVGAEKDHLKLHMCTEQERLSEMNGIAFKLGKHASYISKGLAFDICYAIQENVWQGKTTIQLGVRDLKIG
jgi:single-stranded-DNA-specific exonuclease